MDMAANIVPHYDSSQPELKGNHAQECEEGPIFAPPSSFLVKLVELIENEPDDLVEWHSGDLILRDPVLLSKEILPKYFRHNRFQSFQRQLNNFGFRKTDGKGKHVACIYTHDDLKSGCPPHSILKVPRRHYESPSRVQSRLQHHQNQGGGGAGLLAGVSQRGMGGVSHLLLHGLTNGEGGGGALIQPLQHRMTTTTNHHRYGGGDQPLASGAARQTQRQLQQEMGRLLLGRDSSKGQQLQQLQQRQREEQAMVSYLAPVLAPLMGPADEPPMKRGRLQQHQQQQQGQFRQQPCQQLQQQQEKQHEQKQEHQRQYMLTTDDRRRQAFQQEIVQRQNQPQQQQQQLEPERPFAAMSQAHYQPRPVPSHHLQGTPQQKLQQQPEQIQQSLQELYPSMSTMQPFNATSQSEKQQQQQPPQQFLEQQQRQQRLQLQQQLAEQIQQQQQQLLKLQKQLLLHKQGDPYWSNGEQIYNNLHQSQLYEQLHPQKQQQQQQQQQDDLKLQQQLLIHKQGDPYWSNGEKNYNNLHQSQLYEQLHPQQQQDDLSADATAARMAARAVAHDHHQQAEEAQLRAMAMKLHEHTIVIEKSLSFSAFPSPYAHQPFNVGPGAADGDNTGDGIGESFSSSGNTRTPSL